MEAVAVFWQRGEDDWQQSRHGGGGDKWSDASCVGTESQQDLLLEEPQGDGAQESRMTPSILA